MKRTALIVTISAVLVISGTAAAIVAGFPDVPDDHIHANGIQWASDNNLMRGYDNGNFGPEDPVTRAQLSTIFFRYDNTLDDAGTGGGGTQGPQGPQGPRGPQGVPGTPGTNAQVTAQVGIGAIPPGEPITIGGPIADNHTPLPGATLSLPAGDYLIQVYGAFQIPNLAGPIECNLFVADIWPQLTFWMDEDGGTAGEYDGGEGLISPNVLMPDCNGRHANVSGEIVISPDVTTSVGLIAFGYNSAGSSEGSGAILGGGGLIVQPLGTLTFGNTSEDFAFEGEGGPS